MGEDADLIEHALTDSLPIVRVSDMQEAVITASKQAQDNDVVLLSPACASFDMFAGFEQRGDVFAECVHALHKRGPV